jgi:enolase
VNRCVTESGSLTCSLDTPQQGLDLVESSILSAIGEESASNIQIALNMASNELYDQVIFFLRNRFKIAEALISNFRLNLLLLILKK